jgi:hypothetical protein
MHVLHRHSLLRKPDMTPESRRADRVDNTVHRRCDFVPDLRRQLAASSERSGHEAREQPPIRVDRGRAPELCESAQGRVEAREGADPF